MMRAVDRSRRRASLGTLLKAHTALATVAAIVMADPAAAQTTSAEPAPAQPGAPEPAVSPESDIQRSDEAVPSPDVAPEAVREEIIVTGSRIGRSGFTSPTPLTVVSAEQIENSGITNVGQLASQIPAFQATFTPATSTLQSQLAGAALLNLRNLGNVRTLILVNGRRFVPTTTSSVIDTNVIPSSIIDRVDVVTGGASAAYGSDAVAGVVNLILKDDLQGFTGDVQAGISTHGDNATYKGSVAWGTSFAGGAGHLTLAAEGEINRGASLQSGRDWSSRAYGLISNPGFTTTNGQFRRYILPDFQLGNASLGGLITSGPLRGTDFGPGGVPRPFTFGQYAANFQIGGSGVQGSDYIQLTVPFERYSLYATGEYDFGGVTAFFEASHAYSLGDSRLTPIFNLGNITIQRDNAFLAPELAARVTGPFSFGRFSPDIGYIKAEDSNKTDRVVLGLNGKFGGNWRWNVYGEYGHTYYESFLPDNVITARFARSVDAVRSGGNIVCRVNANASATDDDPACVPVNLFGEGSPSQGAIDYFTGATEYLVSIDERVAAASVQGDLFNIGDRPVSAAFGAEYRTEEVDGVSDPISQATGFLSGNPKALAGKYNIKEAFGEILIPLLRDVPLFRSLELNAAGRVTDYSISGTVVTWKGGVTWQVIDDVRLRATRSRDIRAPNFDELFTNALFRFTTVRDPVTGAQGSINIITQGNLDLDAEEADTLTAGIVLTPTFIPGLRASVDYFDIKVRGAIGQLGGQDLVDRCAAGNTELCGFITRNAAGAITSVTSTQINLSEIATRGVDLELAYNLPLTRLGMRGEGSLNLRGLATYVDTYSTDDGLTDIDRVGNVGTSGGGGLPRWKFNVSLTYDDGPFTLFVQNRFVGGGKYDVTFGPLDLNDNSISGRNYVDTSLQYAVVDDGRNRLQLFLNVRNLLDQDPPLAPSSFQTPAQTNAVLYDVIGRQFAAGARFRF